MCTTELDCTLNGSCLWTLADICIPHRVQTDFRHSAIFLPIMYRMFITRSMKLTSHLYVVPSIEMRAAVPPVPHTYKHRGANEAACFAFAVFRPELPWLEAAQISSGQCATLLNSWGQLYTNWIAVCALSHANGNRMLSRSTLSQLLRSALEVMFDVVFRRASSQTHPQT